MSTDTSRFHCDRCNKCCKQHRVPITGADLHRLAQSPALAKQALDDWAELLSADQVDLVGEPESLALCREGRRLLTLKHKAGACVFLDEEAGCTIHTHRPSACRTYPFDRPGKGQLALGLVPGTLCPPETGLMEALASADQGGEQESRTALMQRDKEAHSFATFLRDYNAKQRTRLRLRRLPLAERDYLAHLSAEFTD